jgi:hypothetical protein
LQDTTLITLIFRKFNYTLCWFQTLLSRAPG